MKKKILISFVAVLILVITGIVLLLANINTLIETHRDKIETLASESIGTTVKLGSLKASFIPLGIKATEVKIGNEKESSGLNSFFVSLRLLPLFTKTADITNLEFTTPELTLVKDKTGIFLVGLPREKNSTAKKKNNVTNNRIKDQQPEKTSENSIELPISIKLNAISVKDGKLSFKNKINNSEMVVSDIDFQTALTVEDSVAHLKTGNLSAKINSTDLDIKYSDATYNLKTFKAELKSLTLNTAAGTIKIKANVDKDLQGDVIVQELEFNVKKLFNLAKPYLTNIQLTDLDGTLNSKLEIHLNGDKLPEIDGNLNLDKIEGTFNNLNLRNLFAKTVFNSEPLQTATISPLSFLLNDEEMAGQAKVSFAKETIALEDLSLKIFNGLLKLLGNFQLNTKKFSSKVALENVDLGLAVKTVMPKLANTISGTLSSFLANVNGNASKDLVKSLSGNVAVTVKDGEIKQLNILKDIFQVVSPILLKDKKNDLSDKLKDSFDKKGTIFTLFTVDLSIQGYTTKINKLSLKNDLFTVEGKGGYQINGGNIDLNTDIIFNQTISKELVDRIKELRSGLNQNNTLTFPVKITGNAEGIKVIPDVSMFLKTTIKEKAEKGLEKLFKKLTKKDKEQQKDSSTAN